MAYESFKAELMWQSGTSTMVPSSPFAVSFASGALAGGVCVFDVSSIYALTTLSDCCHGDAAL